MAQAPIVAMMPHYISICCALSVMIQALIGVIMSVLHLHLTQASIGVMTLLIHLPLPHVGSNDTSTDRRHGAVSYLPLPHVGRDDTRSIGVMMPWAIFHCLM